MNFSEKNYNKKVKKLNTANILTINLKFEIKLCNEVIPKNL